MNPPRQLLSKQGVDHAMSLDPALAVEGGADDLDLEMRFPIRVMVMPVTSVMMRLVYHLKELRG